MKQPYKNRKSHTLYLVLPTVFLLRLLPKNFRGKPLAMMTFIDKIDEYTFRVEQMDKGHWWWRVYYKDDAIPERTNEFSNSKYRAIGYCEGLYMGHSLLNGGYRLV